MTPDDLTPDPETAAADAAADAADDAHTERWREERARGREHDAMCPHTTHPFPSTCEICTLVARVRADERERAAGRVRDCDTWLVDYHGRRAVWLGDALAAIREGGA